MTIRVTARQPSLPSVAGVSESREPVITVAMSVLDWPTGTRGTWSIVLGYGDTTPAVVSDLTAPNSVPLTDANFLESGPNGIVVTFGPWLFGAGSAGHHAYAGFAENLPVVGSTPLNFVVDLGVIAP